MINQPILRPRPGKNLYELVEEYGYACTINNERIEISAPAGFLFDGASIPAIGWVLTYTPFHPDVIGPAVIHDRGYETHEVDRLTMDSILYQMLIDNRVEKVIAEIMYAAVRGGGLKSWRGKNEY